MKSHLGIVLSALLVACTTETTPSSANGGVGPGSATPADENDSGERLLYRTTSEWTPYTSPFGETSMVYRTRYDLLALYATGYAYVGEPNAIDDVVCDRPKQDAKKHKVCVPYRIEGSSIELDSERKSYEVREGLVMIGDGTWRVVPKNTSAVGKLALAGYFGAQAAVEAKVSGATVVLAEDGSFIATRAKSSYTILASEFWPRCESGCEISGSYTVRPRSITFTTSAGKSRTFFLRADGAEVQIGSEWYAR